MDVNSLFQKKSQDKKRETTDIPSSWKVSKENIAEGLKAYSEKIEKYKKRFDNADKTSQSK